MKKTTKIKLLGQSSGKGYSLTRTKEERLRRLLTAMLIEDDLWRESPQGDAYDVAVHYIAAHHMAWKVIQLTREVEEENAQRTSLILPLVDRKLKKVGINKSPNENDL
jgi:hypothetical protein